MGHIMATLRGRFAAAEHSRAHPCRDVTVGRYWTDEVEWNCASCTRGAARRSTSAVAAALEAHT